MKRNIHLLIFCKLLLTIFVFFSIHAILRVHTQSIEGEYLLKGIPETSSLTEVVFDNLILKKNEAPDNLLLFSNKYLFENDNVRFLKK